MKIFLNLFGELFSVPYVCGVLKQNIDMEKVKKREAVYPKDLVVDKIYCDLENADKKPTLLKFVRVEDNACYFECLDNHFMYLGYNEGRKKIVGFFGLDHPFYLPTEKDYQELNIAQYENN